MAKNVAAPYGVMRRAPAGDAGAMRDNIRVISNEEHTRNVTQADNMNMRHHMS